ncbi:MAG: Fic family protein [bacterium]|nr:Fic family protein [bacterium]
MKKSVCWQPVYTLTTSIARNLLDIETARVVLDKTPLPAAIQIELSRKARIRSTHYSTSIEGNRLTIQEAEDVISQRHKKFLGRERDILEVKNYWNALARVEEWAATGKPVSEDIIRRIYTILIKGIKTKPLPYRDGHNIIRDSLSGGIVYLPPETHDVPVLMGEMVEWIEKSEKERVPAAIIAGLAHYQFVTIHPFYDGNGRTARLLATFILQKMGYGMNGLYSLEEYHSHDLEAYYRALDTGNHHNYYMGRAKADLTGWLEYFTGALTLALSKAKEEALQYLKTGGGTENIRATTLHKLDHRARLVRGLFEQQELITSNDVVIALGLSARMARVLLKEWVAAGWLVIASPSNRTRSYALKANRLDE